MRLYIIWEVYGVQSLTTPPMHAGSVIGSVEIQTNGRGGGRVNLIFRYRSRLIQKRRKMYLFVPRDFTSLSTLIHYNIGRVSIIHP